MKRYDRNATQTKEDGAFEQLPVGGYVVKITAVRDVNDREYLAIEYDIAEGPHKGYHAETFQRARFWGGKFNRSYSKKSQPFFNGFLSAVEKSNPGYEYDWNEHSLLGKLVGVVTREREYISTKDGSVRVGQEVDQVRSVDKIRSGDFKVRERRLLNDSDKAKAAASSVGYEEVQGEELPFQ